MAEIDTLEELRKFLAGPEAQGSLRDPSRHMALLENSSNKAEVGPNRNQVITGSQHCSRQSWSRILKNTNSCSLNSSSFPITAKTLLWILLCPGVFVPQENVV